MQTVFSLMNVIKFISNISLIFVDIRRAVITAMPTRVILKRFLCVSVIYAHIFGAFFTRRKCIFFRAFLWVGMPSFTNSFRFARAVTLNKS